MKQIKIYTSGAEKNATTEHTSWRQEIKTLENKYIKFINPMNHFDYDTRPASSAKECRNYFMWLIDKCDIVLVNLDYTDKSVGTGMEVHHAYDTNKPIIGFGIKQDTWYEWVIDECDVVFNTAEEAIDYIITHYVYL